jgi:hypothetical protein
MVSAWWLLPPMWFMLIVGYFCGWRVLVFIVLLGAVVSLADLVVRYENVEYARMSGNCRSTSASDCKTQTRTSWVPHLFWALMNDRNGRGPAFVPVADKS